MLQLVGRIHRKHALGLDAFSEHWRSVHRELALRLAEAGIMRGYVQNHRIDRPVAGLAPAADGCPELWVDNVNAMQAIAASPAYLEGAALDEPEFMRPDVQVMMAARLSREGDEPRQALGDGVKLMLFFRPGTGVSPEQLKAAWLEGDSLTPQDGLRRAELYARVEAPLTDNDFTFVEATWWRDHEAFDRAWERRRSQLASELIDVDGLRGMQVEELPVLWPRGDPTS